MWRESARWKPWANGVGFGKGQCSAGAAAVDAAGLLRLVFHFLGFLGLDFCDGCPFCLTCRVRKRKRKMEWVRSVTVEEDKIELLLKSGGYGGGFAWLLAACPPLTEFGWCGKFVVCKCNFLFKIIECVD